MNRFFVITIFLAAFLAFPNSSFGQRGFDEYGTEQEIRIQYRWARHIPVDPISNAALSLRLTNQHEHAVNVTLTVSFYRNEQLIFENRDNNYCLEAGQSLRGSLANLRFMAEGISMDMIREPWFSWKISAIEVTPVVSCK